MLETGADLGVGCHGVAKLGVFDGSPCVLKFAKPGSVDFVSEAMRRLLVNDPSGVLVECYGFSLIDDSPVTVWQLADGGSLSDKTSAVLHSADDVAGPCLLPAEIQWPELVASVIRACIAASQSGVELLDVHPDDILVSRTAVRFLDCYFDRHGGEVMNQMFYPHERSPGPNEPWAINAYLAACIAAVFCGSGNQVRDLISAIVDSTREQNGFTNVFPSHTLFVNLLMDSGHPGGFALAQVLQQSVDRRMDEACFAELLKTALNSFASDDVPGPSPGVVPIRKHSGAESVCSTCSGCTTRSGSDSDSDREDYGSERF